MAVDSIAGDMDVWECGHCCRVIGWVGVWWVGDSCGHSLIAFNVEHFQDGQWLFQVALVLMSLDMLNGDVDR